LRLDGGLSKERYMEQYSPIEVRLQQLDNMLPELEAEIDVRTIQLLSGEVVVNEAKTLHDEWHKLPFEQKRNIVETITSDIEVGKEDITITLSYAPPLSQIPKKSAHHHRDSYSRQA
jgi:site-specific DNA recombinase